MKLSCSRHRFRAYFFRCSNERRTRSPASRGGGGPGGAGGKMGYARRSHLYRPLRLGPAVLFSPRVIDRGFAPQPMDLHCRSSASVDPAQASRSGAFTAATAHDPAAALRMPSLYRPATAGKRLLPGRRGSSKCRAFRFENTAAGRSSALLAGESGLYRRQIEKSVKYLLEAKPQED